MLPLCSWRTRNQGMVQKDLQISFKYGLQQYSISTAVQVPDPRSVEVIHICGSASEAGNSCCNSLRTKYFCQAHKGQQIDTWAGPVQYYRSKTLIDQPTYIHTENTGETTHGHHCLYKRKSNDGNFDRTLL